MENGDGWEQQSIFPEKSEDKNNSQDDNVGGKPLYREDPVDDTKENEGKSRLFEKGTCVKVRGGKRESLLITQDSIIAQEILDGRRDKEGFVPHSFVANVTAASKSEHLKAGKGDFWVTFSLKPEYNILWIRTRDGSIKKAKEYFKNHRIGLD